jgi:hypothetical protein
VRHVAIEDVEQQLQLARAQRAGSGN